MATYSFSEFFGGSCGSSSGNLANIQCLTIGNCNEDIEGHLKSYKVRDSALDTEARLLLVRAGNFVTYNQEVIIKHCSLFHFNP